MNILYYIPNITQEGGGIRQYAKGILEAMAKNTDNRYLVYHNNDDKEIINVLSCNHHLMLIKDTDVFIPFWLRNRNIKTFIKYLNIFLKKLRISRDILIPSFIDLLCDQFYVDIIHCPYQFIPETRKAKLITTLHDVQELHFPEFFSPQDRASRAVGFMDILSRADKIIVSYNHVKKDIIKYFQIPENKINIVLINIKDLWINYFTVDKIIDVKDITKGGDFLLYPANTWKHKNHLNLVRAISLLRDKFNLKIKIVCTGHKNEHFESIDNLLKELNLESQFIFTDIVSEHILYSLYKTCIAVVIPSLYEAGSFPLYESILLNVPVICSNVTSLPETISNEECLFNPFDIENIAFKIKEIWTDGDFRDRVKTNLKIALEKINLNDPLPILQEIYLSLKNGKSNETINNYHK